MYGSAHRYSERSRAVIIQTHLGTARSIVGGDLTNLYTESDYRPIVEHATMFAMEEDVAWETECPFCMDDTYEEPLPTANTPSAATPAVTKRDACD